MIIYFSYAPYNNIQKMDYPHIFITTSLSDNRVLFDEPAKFTAKLREYKTDNNLLLLKTENECWSWWQIRERWCHRRNSN